MKSKKSKGKAGRAPRKPGNGSKLALAIVTCVNLLLTLVLAVLRRQDTLKAVQGDGKLKLLLEQADGTEKKEER